MHLSELKSLHVSKLLDWALELGIENANRMRKQELMFAILKKRAKEGEQIFGDGTLEVLPDGFGFLRSPETSYLASTFRPRKFDASTFTRATPLKVKFVRQKMVNVISHS